MRAVKGPKHQGGWVMLAVAAAGVVGSMADQKEADKQSKVKYEDSRDLDTLQFAQKDWLNQQAHAWELEDYQRAKNYNEDAIRGFAQYAPPNTASPDGKWQAPPERTDVSADTAGMAPRDVNGQPYLIDPRTGKPVYGADPMSQVA
jgi:hypothetical protein